MKILNQKKLSKAEEFELFMKKRVFKERYIFILVDGQDLLSPGKLIFTHCEINEKLCRLIPQTIWESKQA